jgi:hypothetical protein
MKERLKFVMAFAFWFVVIVGGMVLAGLEGLDLRSQEWGPEPEMEEAREVYAAWFCLMPFGWALVALVAWILGRRHG